MNGPGLIAGLALGGVLLLCAAPWLWPPRGRTTRTAGLLAQWRTRLTQAGLGSVSPATFAAVCLVLAGITGFAVLALVPVTALGVLAGLAAGLLPVVVVDGRARAYRRGAALVWPDAVDQLVSAIRSGLPLPEAVAALAESGPVPARAAFERFASDFRSTGGFALCLDELKDRLADPVADRILETLRMAREVGGTELTAVLRTLGASLRAERAIRAELEARQGWLRIAARLGVAAPWIVLALLATRPEAATAYNSPAGTLVIVAGMVVTLVAYRVMIGIGRLPEERRWFA